VNFGHEPFKYDIEDHVQQKRIETWNGILRDNLVRGDADRGPINQLVLSYLAHHGYAKTARAFRTQFERREGATVGVGAPGMCYAFESLPGNLRADSSLWDF
jgi:Ran-binding protein 9/10